MEEINLIKRGGGGGEGGGGGGGWKMREEQGKHTAREGGIAGRGATNLKR